MNHLGDTNKMVSDTPRTDEVTRTYGDASVEWEEKLVPVEACRAIERELNAANAEIEEKRKDVVWLATEKAKLENYVMRLEEAGDKAILNSYLPDRLAVWNKAKEAKL